MREAACRGRACGRVWSRRQLGCRATAQPGWGENRKKGSKVQYPAPERQAWDDGTPLAPVPHHTYQGLVGNLNLSVSC